MMRNTLPQTLPVHWQVNSLSRPRLRRHRRASPLYRGFAGAGTLQALLTNLPDPGGNIALEGVMIRDGLAANAAYVMVAQHPDNQVTFQYRTTAGGPTSGGTVFTGGTAEKRLQLSVASSGGSSTYSGSFSTNNTTFTSLGSVVLTLASPQGGMAVTSSASGTSATATCAPINRETNARSAAQR